jgi:guanine deaminase
MNDMHVHAPQYSNMGVAMDMELIPWLNTYTFPEESKFCDEEYALQVYRNFVSELCRQGTMRASVFSTIHLPATKCLAKIFADAGMGALIGLVGMDRHSPEGLKNTTQSWKEDTETLIQYVSQFPLVNSIITPRFLPSCTPEMLQTMGEIAQAYNLPVQSHLSENKKEIQWVRELEPQSTCYGDAYNRYGLFGQTPTLMAHCCYSDGEELQLLRDNGVYVVHCPTSNCNLASGIAPIRRFLQAGIPVVLGSDIAAGHHLSIFRVMQYAVQMSKLQYALTDGKYPFLTLSEVFYMATKAGGALFGKVGSFEKGYAFDALVIDDQSLSHDTLNTASLIHRLERFIYMGDDRHIAHRFCQGKQITVS